MIPFLVRRQPEPLLGFRCVAAPEHAVLAGWLERDLGFGGAGLEVALFEAMAAGATADLACEAHDLHLEAGVAQLTSRRGAQQLALSFAVLERAVLRWFSVVDPVIEQQLLGPRGAKEAATTPWSQALWACRVAARALSRGRSSADVTSAKSLLADAWRLTQGPAEDAATPCEVYRRLAAWPRELGDGERTLEAARRHVALEPDPLLRADAELTLAEVLAGQAAFEEAAQHATRGAAAPRAARRRAPGGHARLTALRAL